MFWQNGLIHTEKRKKERRKGRLNMQPRDAHFQATTWLQGSLLPRGGTWPKFTNRLGHLFTFRVVLDQLYQRSEIKKKGCFHKLLSEKGLLRGNLTPLAALNGYLVKREAEFIWWRSRMGQNPRAHVAAHYDGFFGRVPLWASLKPLPSENSHSIVALWCKCYQICKKILSKRQPLIIVVPQPLIWSSYTSCTRQGD